MFTSARSMPREKVQHEIVEPARLLPGHGVTGIVDNGCAKP
jgi:hypothetical protein